MDISTRLDRTFSALADPTRRALLRRLTQSDATVSELQKPFGLSQPAISKHLKVLESAGLIERGRLAQSRPRRLRVEALNEASAWLEQIRVLWNESFDRLEDFLEETRPPSEKN